MAIAKSTCKCLRDPEVINQPPIAGRGMHAGTAELEPYIDACFERGGVFGQALERVDRLLEVRPRSTIGCLPESPRPRLAQVCARPLPQLAPHRMVGEPL